MQKEDNDIEVNTKKAKKKKMQKKDSKRIVKVVYGRNSTRKGIITSLPYALAKKLERSAIVKIIENEL